jgi:hypothetical protein
LYFLASTPLEECIGIRNGEDNVRASEAGWGGFELADVGFGDLDALRSVPLV